MRTTVMFFVTGPVIIVACKLVALVLDGHHSLATEVAAYAVATAAILVSAIVCLTVGNKQWR